MGLDLIDLFVKIQRVFAVNYGTQLIFFVFAIDKNFFAVNQQNSRHVCIGIDLRRSRYVIFYQILLYRLTLLRLLNKKKITVLGLILTS